MLPKPGASTAIVVPYVKNGPDLQKNYLDFFDLNPITGCSLTTCTYRDTCGSATLSGGTNVVEVDPTASPYTLSYKQSIKEGYGPINLCLRCESTNSVETFYHDHPILAITQGDLNCDLSLVAITQPNPI